MHSSAAALCITYMPQGSYIQRFRSFVKEYMNKHHKRLLLSIFPVTPEQISTLALRCSSFHHRIQSPQIPTSHCMLLLRPVRLIHIFPPKHHIVGYQSKLPVHVQHISNISHVVHRFLSYTSHTFLRSIIP